MKIAALTGGTGGAKLLRGLCASMDPRSLTVVGNTGDDAEIWGLHVSPDLDSVTYALAGRLDVARGWGRAGESFHVLEAMAALGEDTWFQLGDLDLATHLFRTRALRAGASLTAVTATIAPALGAASTVLPMTDAPVRTRLRTPDGWLDFQEYFVREKARPRVLEVEYAGAAVAAPTPAVLDAISGADAIVVCPSNPVTSVGPILALPGMVEALVAARAKVIAVSPIVGGAAVSGPAGELMRARGLPVSSAGVAAAYIPWIDAMVVDVRDAAQAGELRDLGVEPVVSETLMRDRGDEIALARAVLGALA